MSEESIENITATDPKFAPTCINSDPSPDTKFNGHCLIKNIFLPKKVINLYISYTLDSC